ncbi:LLM class flavin-dependent oxidoreductase [Neokomagataea tanensis]|uniref:LLM class flavin-dependent oxidoreductase n=3 Tax=Neokomagataea TaxID=1223423 RepID=A0A4Y6V7E8_9PROT|nr:LLM class flavin-dependent oxidoreductase [Neokomagataea tanensis]
MTCVSHQASGLWRHPNDQAYRYKTISYWTELAQILEKGLFDGLFIADVLGTYDVYGGSPDAALRNAAQVPVNDPAVTIAAMAAVTKHLGFGLTAALSYEHPYPFARRMSTLDHLTQGRIGWNIVTGYLDSAARGNGHIRQESHDTRYDIAHDYLDVVTNLWNNSWDDGAVLHDKERGVYTDPSKVHRITHNGPYFSVDAIHLCEPSPQRTPVLYQAGTSRKGRAFAGKYAECVFLAGPSVIVAKNGVETIRSEVSAQGRKAESVRIFSLVTVVTGANDAEAHAKYDEYRSYVSLEGALTLMSGWTGVDFSTYSPDEPVKHIRNDAIHSAIDALTVTDPDRVWTVRELAEHSAIGGLGVTFIGGPETIADKMEKWIDQTGVDGFNLAYAVTPGSFEDFIKYVIPELQRRGRYKTKYREGTLREKLFSPIVKNK